MPKFLVDENLSPKLAGFLRDLGYKASASREVSLKGQSDEKIIEFARSNDWIIVTADLGFGEVFYFNTAGKVGFIILRSPWQSTESYQKILEFLHIRGVLKEDLKQTLIIASHTTVRRRTIPNSSLS